MRDKQAQAQVYLADLDVQHQQLQEACAAQDTQDDQILLLEVKPHCLAFFCFYAWLVLQRAQPHVLRNTTKNLHAPNAVVCEA